MLQWDHLRFNNSTNLVRRLSPCLRGQWTGSTVHLCCCGFQQYTGCNLQGACAVGEMSLRRINNRRNQEIVTLLRMVEFKY